MGTEDTSISVLQTGHGAGLGERVGITRYNGHGALITYSTASHGVTFEQDISNAGSADTGPCLNAIAEAGYSRESPLPRF